MGLSIKKKHLDALAARAAAAGHDVQVELLQAVERHLADGAPEAKRARERAEVAAKIDVLAAERADPKTTLEGLGDPSASHSSSDSASSTAKAATASPLRRWALGSR